MSQKIRLVLRKIKKKCIPQKPSLTQLRLTDLVQSCEEYLLANNIQSTQKILWPTLFNQTETFWAHDGILILALKVRGIDVFPTICDKLQGDECVIHGGLWQHYYEKMYGDDRKSLCEQCVNNDLRLWDIMKIRPIRLSSYLTEGEREQIWAKVNKIMEGDWQKYSLEGYPVGKEALKAVLNMNLQGEIKPHWKNEADQRASHHIFNILALMEVYKRIISIFKPDKVVGNGGFYYLWGALNHLCQELKIPYYRYYRIGVQPTSWNYALNTTDIVDLTHAFDSWIKEPWTKAQQGRVIEDLKLRGHDVTSSPERHQHIEEIKNKLKLSSKPTALILSGVIWDAATNVESIAFTNMYEWLFATIEWFSSHPQYQLVIRIHPAENVAEKIAPIERTKFERELKARGIAIPDNVFLISPETKISTYHVMHLADVGMVYTSTTGLEFACLAKPLITIGKTHYRGKGFTLDPNSQNEYFSILENCLTKQWTKQEAQLNQTLAMKYWYLYAFHGSTVMGLFESQPQSWRSIRLSLELFSSHPKKLTVKDLLPGANEQIDFFCETVINNLRFMDKNRWPPHISEEFCQR